MGKTSKAPAGYQPSWQGGADQNYQSLIQNSTPYATSLPGQVAPGLGQAAQNVVNNPYYNQAQQAANGTAAIGATDATAANNRQINLDQLAGLDAGVNSWQGGQLAGLSQASQAAGQHAGQVGNQALGQTNALIPSTTQGGQYAAGQLGNADALANYTSNTALSAIPGLTGGMDAANQVLQTGFDPQNQLYDRTLQQTIDQQNALNSMNGVAGSGYGAGIAGDATRNFNIDWQNQQLNRQTQALGAYGTEQGVVENNLTGLLGSASNNYANLTNAGVNQYTGLTSNAVGNLTNLVNTGTNAFYAGNAQKMAGIAQAGALTNDAVNNNNSLNANQASMFGAATQQGQDALQTYLSSQQAPMQTFQNQQQAALAALTSQAQGTSQALAPSQAVGQMDSDYLSLGQGATQNAQNATKINNASTGGLGQLIGTVASIALSPASSGLSLFGLGGGGGGPSIAGGLAAGNVRGLDTSAVGGVMPGAGFVAA